MKKTSRSPRTAKNRTGVLPASTSDSRPRPPAPTGQRSVTVLASHAPAPPSSSQADRTRAITNSLP